MKKAKRRSKKKKLHLLAALLVLLLAASSMSWGRPRRENQTPTETEAPGYVIEGSSFSPGPAADSGDTTEDGHVHSWTPVREMVHRDAVVEDVWILDQEAWREPTQVWKELYQCQCEFEGGKDELEEHRKEYEDKYNNGEISSQELQEHSTFTNTSRMVDSWIVHEAEGHWESQVIMEARDEMAVTGYTCDCGATK